jgi:hypothetical protein
MFCFNIRSAFQGKKMLEITYAEDDGNIVEIEVTGHFYSLQKRESFYSSRCM